MSTRYLDINELVIDKEFEELLPILSTEESEKLEKSILKHGLLDPIKYGKISILINGLLLMVIIATKSSKRTI